MRVVRGLHLRVICTLLGLVAAATSARAEEGMDAAWTDPALLDRHMTAACDAVEAVCRGRFVTRPVVRVSTQEDIGLILRSRLEGEMGMLEAAPDESRTYLAYYDPTTLTVHILPSALGAIAEAFDTPELLHENVLRMVLVHEATHALDYQRFPVRWTLACCAASDERLATEAVLEGHAQLVTEEVSRRWATEEAFQHLTRLYTGVSFTGDEEEFLGFDQEAAFAYLQGHAFMRTVKTARGRAGVDACLRDPPFETRVIDRPILWLQPERRGEEPDLQALVESFRPLVPGPEWDVSKWRVLGPAVPMMQDEASGGQGVVESYLDNHGLYAGAPGGNRYFNVFCAYCRSEKEAKRFVKALRGVDEARDTDPQWQPATRREGAGTGGRLTGFTSRRRATGMAQGTDLTLQVVREGAHVIEWSAYGLAGADRAAQDRTLDLAARLLRSTPQSAAAVALRIHLREFLTARALGQVERARVLMRDLLPSAQDLRRVVKPEFAGAFAERYEGARLQRRTTLVPDATITSAFEEVAPDSLVRAWAATTEQLAAGEGWSSLFPVEMRTFGRDNASPGMTWIVLVLTTASGERLTYACFARFGDRFLWVKDPWDVLR